MTQPLKDDLTVAAGVFLLVAVAYGYFFGGAGWNQDANFDLVRALVERQTLYIDGYDVNTGDVSTGTGGHTYINKPPGLSLLAAVPYAIVFAAERLAGVEPDQLTHANAWIVTFATCGLCGAAIASILFLFGRRRVGASPAAALAIALVIAFGTIAFSYSTMLFAHVPAALFILLSVVLLRSRPVAAGFAAAAAMSCFYVCALAALIVTILALFVSIRHAVRVIAGAAPIAIALALYQWSCFGSPFRTAVEESAPFTEKGLLFGVLRAPRLDALYGISLSPYRGLFYASPILLFAIPGLVRMWKRADLRIEWTATVTITIAFFVSIASFNGWSGGWAFGPRYILPVIPLLALPLAFTAAMQSKVGRTLWIAAAAISVAVNFVATATDAMPSPDVRNPVVSYLVPAFSTGRIPESTRIAFPWYHDRQVGKVSLPRDSANLGALVFPPHGRDSLIPIALWIVIGSTLLFRGNTGPSQL